MANQAQQAPWSVKGIAPQTREAVKEAARRSGMTIGEWLNAAITQQAESPLPPRHKGSTPQDLRWAEIATHLAKYVRAEPAPNVPLPAPQMVSTQAIEQLLKEAQARQEQQSREQSIRLAEALTGLARYIENTENRRQEEMRTANTHREHVNADLAHTLAIVAHRIKRVEKQLSQLPLEISAPLREVTTQQTDLLATKILPVMEERLAAQMREILATLSVNQAQARAVSSYEQAGGSTSDAEQLNIEERLARAIVDIRSRQVELARLEANADDDTLQREILERLEGLSRQLDAALSTSEETGTQAGIDAVLTRLDRIDSRLDNVNAPSGSAQLEDMVRNLSASVEALHFSSTESAVDAAALDALAEQISQLAQRLDEMARQTLHSYDETTDNSKKHERFTALEAAVSTLSLQLRDLPRADAESLERLARSAAREALAVLSTDDSILRSEHWIRADDTLNAVHSTLERVVDRLAQLEDDIRARSNTNIASPGKFTSEPERRAAQALMHAGTHLDRTPTLMPTPEGPEDLLARKSAGLTENVGVTASFIAAARRAAMAAADETRITTADMPFHPDNASLPYENDTDSMKGRRRSLLLGLGALIAATGAAQIAAHLMHGASHLS